MHERFSNLFYSAERVNGASIFACAYQVGTCGHVDAISYNTIFEAIKNGINDLNSIKQNSRYRDFISNELGHNLEKGFYNLRKSALIIDIDSEAETENFVKNYRYDEGYASLLTISKNMVSKTSKNKLSTVVAHELGHLLTYAAEYPHDYSEFLLKDPDKQSYGGDIKNNWKMEFDADAISVASNFDNQPYDVLIETPKKNLLSRLYHKGFMPEFLSGSLSDFCLARNEFVLKKAHKFLDRYGLHHEKKLVKACNFMDLSISLTHPPKLSRLVEADKFKSKAIKALDQQKLG